MRTEDETASLGPKTVVMLSMILLGFVIAPLHAHHAPATVKPTQARGHPTVRPAHVQNSASTQDDAANMAKTALVIGGVLAALEFMGRLATASDDEERGDDSPRPGRETRIGCHWVDLSTGNCH